MFLFEGPGGFIAQRFLVRPLNDDSEIPADAIIVHADCVETLVKAQAIQQTIQSLLTGKKLAFNELKRLARTSTQPNQSG